MGLGASLRPIRCSIVLPANHQKVGEPTSGLEPLTCSLRVISQACRGVQGIALAAYLRRFFFSALLGVAPYCVPGGVRVVSQGLQWYAGALSLSRYSAYLRRIKRADE